jgi:hypothetical protein
MCRNVAHGERQQRSLIQKPKVHSAIGLCENVLVKNGILAADCGIGKPIQKLYQRRETGYSTHVISVSKEKKQNPHQILRPAYYLMMNNFVWSHHDPYFDSLPWPLNPDSKITKETGIEEPSTSFRPPASWKFQCPVCGARQPSRVCVCWNWNYLTRNSDARRRHIKALTIRRKCLFSFVLTSIAF